MGMVQIDRHIALSAGWVAGPAFGVAMMAAPEYLHLSPSSAAFCFWGGIVIFSMTIVVLGILSFHNIEKQKQILWPVLVVSLWSILCIGAIWYFWPSSASKTEALSSAAASSHDVLRDVEIEPHRAAIISKLRAKYPHRIIADVTPNYLMDLYNDKMPIDGDRLTAPFIGNWVLLSGPIWSVSTISTNLIDIVLEPHIIRVTYMFFDGQTDRLSVLRQNQTIWAFCQLKEATNLDVHFEHCELIDQDSGP